MRNVNIANSLPFLFPMKVEAEHQEQSSIKEQALKEKDAIIAALGAQLAESHGSLTSFKDQATERSTELKKAQSETTEAKREAETVKEELEKICKDLEDFKAKRDEAIEAARNETIQEATVQFEKFNEMYRDMRNSYQSSRDKVCKN